MALPPVAILAGGLATRMRPLTERVPKAMLPVGGEPFIAHQLRLLAREGVTEVVLCLGHLGDVVAAFVGDGSAFGLAVRHAYDGERLLGTGGALRRALPMLGDAFFVLYGDSYLDIAFAPVHAAFLSAGKPALMTIFRNDGQWDRSNVLRRPDGSILYDKRRPDAAMGFIDYGLGVITAAALAHAPADTPFDLADVYHALSVRGDLASHEIFVRFHEIGTPEGLADTEQYLTIQRTLLCNHP
jgi:NDP-sugar pyrophosphorylase family protein